MILETFGTPQSFKDLLAPRAFNLNLVGHWLLP